MELTLYLAKVLGIGLIIMGAAIAIRRDYYIPVFAAFVDERLLRAIMSVIELMAGLFLIVGHTAWSPAPAAIISLLGWLAVIEATTYLMLPDRMLRRYLAFFSTPAWYIGGGILCVALGLYLAGFGFGWW